MTTIPTKTYYVYSLADGGSPPFYIGKGMRGRLFHHEKEAFSGCPCLKCETIRSIWQAGREVVRNICFETEDESEAYILESQLIAEYGLPNLCNLSSGNIPKHRRAPKHPKPLKPPKQLRMAMPVKRRHGEGSVYQRKDGRWGADMYLGTINGKRKHKVFYGYTAEEACLKRQAYQNATIGTPPADQAVKLGDIMRDGRKMGSVIRASDIPAMRRAHTEGESYTSIGKRYGISNVAARNAIKGRTWKEVPT